MYNLTKLSPDSFQFIKTLTGQGSKSSELVAMAIARAIVFKLPMPAAKLDSPADGYTEQALPYIRAKISLLSDMFAMDASRTLELARKFWMMRYGATYPSEFVFALAGTPTISYMLGFGEVFSDIEITTIKENMQVLAVLTNNFVKVLNDICTE